MKILLISISKRGNRGKSQAADELTREYVERAERLCPTELMTVESEAAVLAAAERQTGRPAGVLVLFDSAGKTLNSEEFAEYVGRLRDEGAQRLIFAIGPADGWSTGVREAHRTVSLGRMTLPHELARAVAAEQIYRALTILAGHPYHSGH
jgi:23S rRNA (pseudouridine1915-N3)-methyltransferase